MKIAIDGRELCGKPTGVGRYLANLIEAWDRLPEAGAHSFLVYTPSAPGTAGMPAGPTTPNLSLQFREVPARRGGSHRDQAAAGATGSAGAVWEQYHLATAVRTDRPDVLFAPAYTAPLFPGVPFVVTIHDLSFVAHPEWFPLKMRWRQRLLTSAAARRARRVLTDSAFSRGEIIERLGVPAERVSVIPLGLSVPASSCGGRRDLGREPIVLFVGSIFNRRHLPELFAAVGTVAARHPGVRLEVVGDNRTFPRLDLEAVCSAAGLTGRASIRSYVSDATLADLYSRAGVFVFLSDYEGFGLTPLEALACGVPILVGDTPVAREVYGNAGRFVATTDVTAIAASIERLLFDLSSRAEALSAAPSVLARYSWPAAARLTLSELVAAAGGGPR